MWKSGKTQYTSMVLQIYLFIYNIAIACLSLGIIFYIFLMVNEKQMIVKQEIERTKMLKLKANEGRKGMALKPEQALTNMEGGRKLF